MQGSTGKRANDVKIKHVSKAPPEMLQDRDSLGSGPVLIGIGSNLASARHGPPQSVAIAALAALSGRGLPIVRRSRWYVSAPLPAADQPDFINGVAEIETTVPPATLMDVLHEIETEFGRQRSVANAARVLDLDLLAMGDRIRKDHPTLPHPRLHLRAFVLHPLIEVAPDWRHPVLGRTAVALLDLLPPGQRISLLAES